MIGRYEAWLNGESLSQLDENLIIIDICEEMPRTVIDAASYGLISGTRYLRERRMELSVRVDIAIHEYDVTRRKEICSNVRTWARNGGILTINDRPGQMLRVRCTEAPTIASALKWTEKMRLIFTAYEVPWWEAEYPAEARMAAAAESGTISIIPDGDAEQCPLDVLITAAASVTSVTVETGRSRIELTGLALASGDTLSITNADGLLSILAGGASAMAMRTPESSDDLRVVPGKVNEVRITADGPVTAILKARGRFE